MILGQYIGSALLEALGLPPGTAWFELRCACDEAVTVKCEYYPAGGDGLATVLAEYQLIRREGVDSLSNRLDNFDAWMARRKDAAHMAFMSDSSRLLQIDRVRG